MTNEEAKNLIKRVRTKGSYTGDYYMGFTDSSVPFNADIDILAEALEKQISKKPLHSGVEYYCPSCLSTVGHLTNSFKLKKEHHCICGQAIDWSEND